ncbi:unnamed protein product [Arabis nemorensis]|uniref:Uncharacterized protein n=1 Tax=Arabis nemorensis TaxID=586526 RepID=A0A565C4L5_9BRAS|nr:unnamed protein product [Arabis nemorensis]
MDIFSPRRFSSSSTVLLLQSSILVVVRVLGTSYAHDGEDFDFRDSAAAMLFRQHRWEKYCAVASFSVTPSLFVLVFCPFGLRCWIWMASPSSRCWFIRAIFGFGNFNELRG